MDKIFFALPHSVGQCTKEGASELDSQYIEKHIKALHEIDHKDDWKRSGSGAAFTMQENKISTEKFSDIAGVCKADDDHVYYSAVIKEVAVDHGMTRYISGIFYKSLSDIKEKESHIIHSSGELFGSVDFNGAYGEIVTSIGKDGMKDIGVFLTKDSYLKTITSGDSVDDNPSFSALTGAVLFDSKGIARDNREKICAYSRSAICSINTDGSGLKEILVSDKSDLIRPKQDQNGNLYFIRRPYMQNEKKNVSFGRILLDILLLPFRLIRGIFGFLDLISRASTGKSLMSSGAESTVSKQKSERDMIIDNNLINAERNLKKNKKDKFPGYVPKSWELVMRAKDGTETVLKKGVFDYALCDDGAVAVTNGRYIILIDKDGTETQLYKGEKILRISGSRISGASTSSPFDF